VFKMSLDSLAPPILEVVVGNYASAYGRDYSVAYVAEVPLPEAHIVKAPVTVEAVAPDRRSYVLGVLVVESIALEFSSAIVA